jgi:hypothetical protein
MRDTLTNAELLLIDAYAEINTLRRGMEEAHRALNLTVDGWEAVHIDAAKQELANALGYTPGVPFRAKANGS